MKYLDIVVITMLFWGSVITSGLSINSTNQYKGIYYDHVESTSNVVIHSVEGMNINYSAELNIPGDYYELSFDVVNDSGVDMKVEDFYYHEDDSFIEYQLKYSNGKAIHKGDILKKGESIRLTYKVFYKNMIDSNDYQFDSSFGLQYGQVL